MRATYNWDAPAHGRKGNGSDQHDHEDDPRRALEAAARLM